LTQADWQAVELSLQVALFATALSLPFALAIAYALARWRFPGHGLLNGLVHLPLILPPVVTGYVLLLALGRKGCIGAWLDDWFGIVFAFRWTGAVIAASVMAFPFMVRAIRLAIEAVDRDMERSAASLGASPWRVFTRITLPMIRPGIIVGSVLCFAKALGEFGATISFVGNIPGQTRTIPTAIYDHLQVPGGASAVWPLALLSISLAMSALALSEWLGRRAARAISGSSNM
jgi:molybdate transport system permease protein